MYRHLLTVGSVADLDLALNRLNSDKSKSHTIVVDRRTLWVKGDGSDRYTSEELARGVFVQVGALRTNVFEIRPADAPLAARDKIDSTTVKKSYERVRERLKAAAEKDREEEKGRTILVPDGRCIELTAAYGAAKLPQV